jgi:hypothetical protein
MGWHGNIAVALRGLRCTNPVIAPLALLERFVDSELRSRKALIAYLRTL